MFVDLPGKGEPESTAIEGNHMVKRSDGMPILPHKAVASGEAILSRP
jgi:hypothetical protein